MPGPAVNPLRVIVEGSDWPSQHNWWEMMILGQPRDFSSPAARGLAPPYSQPLGTSFPYEEFGGIAPRPLAPPEGLTGMGPAVLRGEREAYGYVGPKFPPSEVDRMVDVFGPNFSRMDDLGNALHGDRIRPRHGDIDDYYHPPGSLDHAQLPDRRPRLPSVLSPEQHATYEQRAREVLERTRRDLSGIRRNYGMGPGSIPLDRKKFPVIAPPPLGMKPPTPRPQKPPGPPIGPAGFLGGLQTAHDIIDFLDSAPEQQMENAMYDPPFDNPAVRDRARGTYMEGMMPKYRRETPAGDTAALKMEIERRRAERQRFNPPAQYPGGVAPALRGSNRDHSYGQYTPTQDTYNPFGPFGKSTPAPPPYLPLEAPAPSVPEAFPLLKWISGIR